MDSSRTVIWRNCLADHVFETSSRIIMPIIMGLFMVIVDGEKILKRMGRGRRLISMIPRLPAMLFFVDNYEYVLD